MFSPYDQSAAIESFNAHNKALVEKFTKVIESSKTNVSLPAATNLAAGLNSIYLVREGAIQLWSNDKLILYLDEGDLVTPYFLSTDLSNIFKTDFAVVVDEYNIAGWELALSKNQELAKMWLTYLATQLALVTHLAGSLIKEELVFHPLVRTFKPGQHIIEQGEKSTDVFTLLDGVAEVLDGGILVGEVLPNEIFGIIAALTGSTRTATIRAKDRCLVASLPKDKFLSLIKSNPMVVEKLVKDMSTKLVAMNQKVVDFSLGKL